MIIDVCEKCCMYKYDIQVCNISLLKVKIILRACWKTEYGTSLETKPSACILKISEFKRNPNETCLHSIFLIANGTRCISSLAKRPLKTNTEKTGYMATEICVQSCDDGFNLNLLN